MQADFLRLQQIYRLDLHYFWFCNILGGAALPPKILQNQKLVFFIDTCYKYGLLQTIIYLQKTTFYLTNNRKLPYLIEISSKLM